MRGLLSFLYFPFKLLIIITVSPLLSVGYWLFTIAVVIPFYIFRKLLSFTARLADPDLCKIVNSQGHIIARDYQEWHHSPSSIIAVIFKLGGSPTLDQLRQLILRKWVHKFKHNQTHLENPELQQYVTKRCGYLFFKWDRNFNIANHVNLLPLPESQVVNESTLMKIWESMLVAPLAEKQSPWDVHLIPNYECSKTEEHSCSKKQSIVLFRFHHSLSDGVSAKKLLLSLANIDVMTNSTENGLFPNLLLHLKAFFFGPTSVVIKFAKGIDLSNPLHRPLHKKSRNYYILKATTDLETIKKITRTHSDISFHAVLIAAVSGGIRNYFLGKGHKVPLSPIRTSFPIAKVGRSYKLRNDFLFSILDLPVEKKTARKRLFESQKRLDEITRESFVPFMTQSFQAFGLLPAIISRNCTYKSAVTVLYSEMRGPEKIATMNSGGVYEILDLFYNFGVGHDDAGIAFTSISYNGKVHIVLSIDRGVAKSRDSAQSLINLIEKEFEELQYGDSTNL